MAALRLLTAIAIALTLVAMSSGANARSASIDKLREDLLKSMFTDDTHPLEHIDGPYEDYDGLHQTVLTQVYQGIEQLKDYKADISCGSCVSIGEGLMRAIGNTTTFHELEALVNYTCHTKLVKDPLLADVCTVVLDLVLGAIHKHTTPSGRMTWNLTEIACADIAKVCEVPCCETEDVPEQVHLSYTGGDARGASTMKVAWVSASHPKSPIVQYWPTAQGNGSLSTVSAETTTYTSAQWLGFIHSAVMTGLQPGTNYTYRVGSINTAWSEEYVFETLPLNAGTPERPLRIAAFADMGLRGDHQATIAQLEDMVSKHEIDLIIHTGDISYADGDAFRWDRYFREMQPIVARVPWMTTPGNHELPWNFTAYKKRFFMPLPGHGAPEDAMYYDFSIGQFRFLMMDTETVWDTPRMDPVQVDFAEKILAEANAQKQFIFVGFHRPLYCSSWHATSCHQFADWLRTKIEPQLHNAGVGILHTGHIHNYERTYPVYQGVRTGTAYNNTQELVSYVNGAPGCDEGLDGFSNDRPAWSAARISKLGFLHMTLSGAPKVTGDSAKMEYTVQSNFISSLTGTPLDEMHLTKTV